MLSILGIVCQKVLKFTNTFFFPHSDIALVKLPRYVQVSDYVNPIRLSSVPPTAGTDVITMGYGLVYTNVFPQNLQYTQFKTVDLKECAPDTGVCAKGTQSSLCFGDIGGPLVSAITGRLVGIAISTWGDCEVNRPQSFTAISSYIKWIDGIMKSTGFVQNTPDVHL